MKANSFLTYWTVDEVIECLSFGTQRGQVESTLLSAAPLAYETSEISPSPEVSEAPEPDDRPDRKLMLVWDKLPEDIQLAINKAIEKEFPNYTHS